MPSLSWDNLDAFLQADDFAIEATVTPQGGVSRVVSGIFDESYLNTQIGEFELDASQPRLTCKAADAVDLQAKDEVQIDGQRYLLLTGPQFDGTGFAVLSLARG